MVIENEVKKINDAIGNLVYDKVAIRKAYGYYHCRRDADQFKHLEENYGIGTPTSVSFTRLSAPSMYKSRFKSILQRWKDCFKYNERKAT